MNSGRMTHRSGSVEEDTETGLGWSFEAAFRERGFLGAKNSCVLRVWKH